MDTEELEKLGRIIATRPEFEVWREETVKKISAVFGVPLEIVTAGAPPAPRPFRFGDILRYRDAGPLESADERFLFIGTVDGYPRMLKGVIVIVFSSGGWIRIDGYEDHMEVVS